MGGRQPDFVGVVYDRNPLEPGVYLILPDTEFELYITKRVHNGERDLIEGFVRKVTSGYEDRFEGSMTPTSLRFTRILEGPVNGQKCSVTLYHDAQLKDCFYDGTCTVLARSPKNISQIEHKLMMRRYCDPTLN